MFESELKYPSHDPEYEIRALVWEPTAVDTNPKRPRGIIQIVHGMSEHIERYRDFAEFCTSQDFIVCGDDHVGHGKSVKAPDALGVIPSNGKEVMIEDEHQLRQLMQQRFNGFDNADLSGEAVENSGKNPQTQDELAGGNPQAPNEPAPETATKQEPLPYLLLGHSMGSFILRNYLAQYGKGITAAIICGTGHQPWALSKAGLLLSRIIKAIKGEEHKSRLLDSLTTGNYYKQIEGARTPHDWLTRDESVVEKCIADPYCGFSFSTGGIITLTTLTSSMVKSKTIQAVPEHLPLLFIAGEDDPVGEKGAAVKRAVAQFKETGHDNVTLMLYPEMRHEILNEIGKEQVYEDVINWIDEQLAAK